MIDISINHGKFFVKTDFVHKGTCQLIPYRKWDPKAGAWVAPVTLKVWQYLMRNFPAAINTELSKQAHGHINYNGHYFEHYIHKTKPYKHQEDALKFVAGKKVAALFMEMGCGKTKVTIDDASMAWASGKIDAVLVICPNSVKHSWQLDLDKHHPINFKAHIYVSTKKKAAQAFIDSLMFSSQGLKWLIMGTEAFSQGGAHLIATEFLSRHAAAIILDESILIKEHKSIRTEKLVELSNMSVYKRILNGTPLEKGPEDLYSQYHFLNPDIIGSPNFFSFRNRYCCMGGYKGKAIVGYNDMDELLDKLKPYTFRVTKKEALDLPNKIYQVRNIQLSDEHMKVYTSMANDFIAKIPEGQVTVENALQLALRLQQIAGGFIPVENITNGVISWSPVQVKGENKKITEILNILETTTDKVIVWCKFRPEIELVNKSLIGAGYKVVMSHGGVSEEKRKQNIDDFQNDPDVRIFVGQMESGGIGITLTAANIVVYYSNSWRYVMRLQSEDRAHRIGQSRPVVYIDLVAEGTVDESVIQAISHKASFTDMVLQRITDKKSLDFIRGGGE